MDYYCRNCGAEYTQLPTGMRCCCGASLWMRYPHRLTKESIRKEDFSMWRYASALPGASDIFRVSLGEGLTPLVPVAWGDRTIWVKNESQEPTGSFKDRGTALVISYEKHRGTKRVSEDSSGNAGASVAAYAARADISCEIYVPDYTSRGKVVQAMAYGAKVHKVAGSRDHTAEVAQRSSNGCVYIGHNWHPAFVEGVKTLAFELWEQSGFQVPDAVICAVGNGSVAIGLYLGFLDLLNSGQISRLPRIYGVQSKNCNTICRTFRGESVNYTVQPTLAEGIALYRSSKAKETASLIRETGGKMIDVSEQQIETALQQLFRNGFFAEPTSAAAFAGLNSLIESGELPPAQRVCVTLSGNGLKATQKILDMFSWEAEEDV